MCTVCAGLSSRLRSLKLEAPSEHFYSAATRGERRDWTPDSQPRAQGRKPLEVLTTRYGYVTLPLSAAADCAAAGWAAVPGLQELTLQGQLVCSTRDTLKCLSKLTALTNLSWQGSYVSKHPGYALDHNAPADAGLPQIAAALPTSLRVLDFDGFVSDLSDPDLADSSNEPAVLAGLRALMQAVTVLPHLESSSIVQNVDSWSLGGQALFERVKAGDADSDDIDAFEAEYKDNSYDGGESGDEVGSDEVSVEVVAADPVSEQEHLGGMYDGDVKEDAVWEGDDVNDCV